MLFGNFAVAAKRYNRQNHDAG